MMHLINIHFGKDINQALFQKIFNQYVTYEAIIEIKVTKILENTQSSLKELRYGNVKDTYLRNLPSECSLLQCKAGVTHASTRT